MEWEQGGCPWKSQIKKLSRDLICHLILYVLKEKNKKEKATVDGWKNSFILNFQNPGDW